MILPTRNGHESSLSPVEYILMTESLKITEVTRNCIKIAPTRMVYSIKRGNQYIPTG